MRSRGFRAALCLLFQFSQPELVPSVWPSVLSPGSDLLALSDKRWEAVARAKHL